MVKNTLQKAKLDQKNQWKKENRKKKIQKKLNKKQQTKKPKEKYQKTLDIVIVRNKDQQDFNWSLIFKSIKEKYKNFVAKIAHVLLDNDSIQYTQLKFSNKLDNDLEQNNKDQLWSCVNELEWSGRFRIVLFQNLDTIQFLKNPIKRLILHKVHFLRIRNNTLYDNFDEEIEDLNRDHYQIINLNQNQKIQDLLIENFILRMGKKKKQQKLQKVKLWYGKLKKDQWFSFTNYIKVQNINQENYTCLNKDNQEIILQEKNILEMQSAQQYKQIQGMKQSDLINKFLSLRNQILKVSYYQKYTSDQVKRLIQQHQDIQKIQQDTIWLQDIIRGRKQEVICYLQQNNIFLGKILVKNLINKTVQQIDARSIQEFIVNQVKYYLIQDNKNQQQQFVSNTQIEEGDWFAYNEYYKVLDILDQKITVLTNSNIEKKLRKKFLEEECLSADNFVKKKKMSLRDIVEKLKGIHSQIFTIEYKQKKQFQQSFERFQSINQEIQNDPKRLRKICKQISFNDRTISIAKQLEINEKFSYSKIYDFNQQKEIEVDHRSISSLIFNNIKYVKS